MRRNEQDKMIGIKEISIKFASEILETPNKCSTSGWGDEFPTKEFEKMAKMLNDRVNEKASDVWTQELNGFPYVLKGPIFPASDETEAYFDGYYLKGDAERYYLRRDVAR